MKFILKFSMLSLLSFPISTFAMESKPQMGGLEKNCRKIVAYASAYKMKKHGRVSASQMSTLELGGNEIEDLESYINKAELISRMNKAVAAPTESELLLLPICSLDLGTNKLNKIPDSFEFLIPSLTTLDISNNCFETIAPITQFTNLKRLYASSNTIDKIEASDLNKLSQLQVLTVDQKTKLAGDLTLSLKRCESGGKLMSYHFFQK
ncbi:leucine-rich repeat domain-containing protein [Candidatus Dependentiae bacterium]|nr:leucine-rich repeat domain-containing protein [Candidatus Dependentiae bacterium]